MTEIDAHERDDLRRRQQCPFHTEHSSVLFPIDIYAIRNRYSPDTSAIPVNTLQYPEPHDFANLSRRLLPVHFTSHTQSEAHEIHSQKLEFCTSLRERDDGNSGGVSGGV